MFDKLAEHGAVIARSPPFTGKTSLQVLLTHWCHEHHPHVRVKDASMLHFSVYGGQNAYQAAEQWHEGWRAWGGHIAGEEQRTWQEDLKSATPEQPLLLLIDEAQKLYHFDVDFPLWHAVKAAQQNHSRTIRILLFVTANLTQVAGSTSPVIFTPEESLSFDDLKLSKGERDFIFNAAAKHCEPIASLLASEGMCFCALLARA